MAAYIMTNKAKGVHVLYAVYKRQSDNAVIALISPHCDKFQKETAIPSGTVKPAPN
jgi:hypothetical protein